MEAGKAKILIVGGAGYVGSATCAWLIDHGYAPWILDDFSTGRRALALTPRLIEARAGNRETVGRLLQQERFDCVFHFAARSLVAESVQKPEEYFENNVLQTQALLDLMLEAGTTRFIFSSTCAIFGDPGTARINETLPKNPMSPYGETKLEVERRLQTMAESHGLKAIALRYFNAAGAEPQLRVGEWHDPESHLIPRILMAAREGRAIEVYGTDYPTPDGTCIRDYIHVTDLAAAHGAAMERLLGLPATGPGRFETFNLGSENGFSVREVIQACEKAVGHSIEIVTRPRRAGDPARLLADSALARRELGFRAVRGLEEIVSSAWKWEQKRARLAARAQKAVFLDRDGTLNEDPGYISDPDRLKLLPGVGEGLAALQKAGYLLVVVSNQSGVGRGLITESALREVHARLDELMGGYLVKLDGYELCFHHPDENCPCRKPKPYLIHAAAERFGVDLARSYMIGDKPIDLAAGRAAGCKAVALVRTGYGRETEKIIQPGEADFVGNSLVDVARWILARENAGS